MTAREGRGLSVKILNKFESRLVCVCVCYRTQWWPSVVIVINTISKFLVGTVSLIYQTHKFTCFNDNINNDYM